MRNRRKLTTVLAATSLLLVGGVTAASASIPTTGTGVIYSCRNLKTGALRAIDYQAGKRCYSTTEKLLSWNYKGVAGPRGLTGATGPAGTSAPIRSGVCSVALSSEFSDWWSAHCTFAAPFAAGSVPIVTVTGITYGFDPRNGPIKDPGAFIDYSQPPTATGFTMVVSTTTPLMPPQQAGGKMDFTYIAVVS